MPGINREQLDKRVEGVFDQVVAWRRHIHENPELSYEEVETAAYIEAELKKMDSEGKYLTVKRPIPNGVIADLKGTRGNSDKIILLRADTDALPVEEAEGLPFRSKRPGVMHACGHDCHTAMLLGAVKLLLEDVESIDGTVRFLFQPAEEVPPGGMKLMLEAGCAEGVTMAFAEHVFPLPGAPTGSVLIRKGPMYNGSTNFLVEIMGKGGHASMPEIAVDPIAASGLVLTAIQNMVTRRLPTAGVPVITVAGIQSSSDSYNVIPDSVTLKGTIRCDSREVRENTIKYFEEAVAGATQSIGAKHKITWFPGCEVTINHPDAYSVCESVLKQVLPSEDKIVYLPNAFKGSEDFSFLALEVPSNYVGIGSYNEEKGCTVANHNCGFRIDEECFKVGVKLHYGIIQELLMP